MPFLLTSDTLGARQLVVWFSKDDRCVITDKKYLEAPESEYSGYPKTTSDKSYTNFSFVDTQKVTIYAHSLLQPPKNRLPTDSSHNVSPSFPIIEEFPSLRKSVVFVFFFLINSDISCKIIKMRSLG